MKMGMEEIGIVFAILVIFFTGAWLGWANENTDYEHAVQDLCRPLYQSIEDHVQFFVDHPDCRFMLDDMAGGEQ